MAVGVYLGNISPRMVDKLVKERQLISRRLGKRVLIKTDSVLKLAAAAA